MVTYAIELLLFHTFVSEIRENLTMAGQHSHASHPHPHTVRFDSLNKAFLLGIVLNIAFVVAEFGAGLWYDSLALLSDAGHNLTDVISLVLALMAFRLTRVKSSAKYTYGYKKSTVLVSFVNAMILLIAIGGIVFESIHKLRHPSPVPGMAIAMVAGIGVLINGFTAFLFLKEKEKDLNVKGAYLHMAADALVSVGVLVSGLIINRTGWYIIDPIIGLVIAAVIFISTWGLLRDSIRLSLDGVPGDIRIEDVKSAIAAVSGVACVYHVHVWAISTTENALTAHIVAESPEHTEQIKAQIRDSLKKFHIGHVTLEFDDFRKGHEARCC